MMCGVSVRTRSVVLLVVFLCENSRPMTGMSPMNGIVSLVTALVRPERPARKFVSPSFSRMFDEIVRVPMIGWLPACVRDAAVRVGDLDVSLSVTSLLWCTRGSTSILMPTSWYWNDVTGTMFAADVRAGVEASSIGIGTLSPMRSCAFWPSEIRSCGLASSSASVLFLMNL